MDPFCLSRRQFVLSAAAASACAVFPVKAIARDNVTVTVSSPWGADKPFQKVVDAYNARKTGVHVINRFDGDYQDMATKALAAIAAGRPPEIMVTGWKFGYFARRTLGARDLREIDASIADKTMRQFTPKVRPLVTIDDSLIGLPWSLSTPVTWINMDLWRAAGLNENIPLDITHEWLIEHAGQLDRALKGGKHPTYRSAIDLSNNEWTSQAYIQNAGGFILDGEKLVCDSPQAIKGMTAFAQPAAMKLWRNMDFRAQQKALFAGNIAIVTTSSSYAGMLAKSGMAFKDAMFPRLDRQRNMNSGGNFLAIYARDQERASAALDFLAFCATQEAQTLWASMGYLNVSNHPLDEKPLQNAALAQLAEGLTPETIWPGNRSLEEQKVWRECVNRIINGEISPVAGMARAKQELQPLIG